MSPRPSIALLVALLAATAAGCGQTGPLALPESARPIEPAPSAEPDQDDERPDER